MYSIIIVRYLITELMGNINESIAVGMNRGFNLSDPMDHTVRVLLDAFAFYRDYADVTSIKIVRGLAAFLFCSASGAIFQGV